MTNDCLVTKLNGSVQNDSLPKFNVLQIKVKDSVSAQSVPNAVAIAGTDCVKSFNEDYTIMEISNKYNLRQFVSRSVGNLLYINLDDFKYCTQLTHLNLAFIDPEYYSGDIANLPNSLKNLYLSKLTTNIADLGHLTKLDTLVNTNQYYWYLTGNIEDFVEAQINDSVQPRTTCTELLIGDRYNTSTPILAGLKFNGQNLTGGTKKVTWNWDGSSANISVTDYSA